MLDHVRYAVVGGGAAAAAAVESIRSRDRSGSIAVFAQEWAPPYQRPPLSKEYLQGRARLDAILMQPTLWYLQNDVFLHTGAGVTAIEPVEKSLRIGEKVVGFESLLLATGATPRMLDVPGADLDGIYTLRTYADAQQLRALRAAAGRIVVIGTGFIGMEVAASLRSGGADVAVTSFDKALWAMFGPMVSSYVERLFERHGVEVVLDNRIDAFEGEAGRVRAVVTSRGRFECDAVVVGVGVRPNDELAAQAGLRVENGIVVDDRLRTTIPHVYAAGDVARFPSLTGELQRVEHFDHAVSSGSTAGVNMAGGDQPYHYVPFFWSDVFELGFEFVGTVSAESRLAAGAPESGSFVVEYLRAGRLQGALLAGRTSEESAAYRERLAAITT